MVHDQSIDGNVLYVLREDVHDMYRIFQLLQSPSRLVSPSSTSLFPFTATMRSRTYPRTHDFSSPSCRHALLFRQVSMTSFTMVRSSSGPMPSRKCLPNRRIHPPRSATGVARGCKETCNGRNSADFNNSVYSSGVGKNHGSLATGFIPLFCNAACNASLTPGQ